MGIHVFHKCQGFPAVSMKAFETTSSGKERSFTFMLEHICDRWDRWIDYFEKTYGHPPSRLCVHPSDHDYFSPEVYRGIPVYVLGRGFVDEGAVIG